MPITYIYDTEKNIVLESPSGVITLSEIHDYLHRVADNPEIPYGVIDICPFHNIEEFDIGPDDQFKIHEMMKNLGEKRKYSVIIFVAAQPYHIGMARMFSQVIESADEGIEADIEKAGRVRLVATNDEAFALAGKIHSDAE